MGGSESKQILKQPGEVAYEEGVKFQLLNKTPIALSHFIESAKLEFPAAHLSLASIYKYYPPVNPKKSKFHLEKIKNSFAWFEKRMKEGRVNDLFNFGRCYELGVFGEVDHDLSTKYYREASEREYHPALHCMGVSYSYGEGVRIDDGKSMAYFLRAAEQGNGGSQFCLGVCHERGNSATPKDYAESMRWYKKAADQGDVEAYHNIGVLYRNGSGVTIDNEKAVHYYTIACEGGSLHAACNLGGCYEKGEGVVQDLGKARELYLLAAENGIEQASYNLGMLYKTGKGVEIDLSIANKWFQLAHDSWYVAASIWVDARYLRGSRSACYLATERILPILLNKKQLPNLLPELWNTISALILRSISQSCQHLGKWY